MKKVLFLQNIGKSFGGVWQVNKLIGTELINNGYEVHIVSVRDENKDLILEHDKRLIVKTINEYDTWGTYQLKDVINEFKKLHFVKSTIMFFKKIKYLHFLKKDIKKLHNYILNYNPDYIVSTHYQILDMIPKNYLNKTIHEQHSSLIDALSNRANKKTFEKYKDKIKFVWLTKNTMNMAIKKGFLNSTYIHNAVRFSSNIKANVLDNKKIISICRLSKDKCLDKMIDIVKDVFSDKKYSDWTFELYGTGPLKKDIERRINNHKQIKLMGFINDPKRKLLSASINLNTSLYEGFSLSILEANECGIPTIAFNFGESAEEQIINSHTGFIVENEEDFKDKLIKLLDDNELLKKMSDNVKNYSNNFNIKIIIKKWIKLFNEFDK